jgi:ABC-type sugar transport system ATPase subunit
VAALAATHLTKSFPGVRAVQDVSLDVLPGEVHGLVGANGAGKSTLVKMLSGACRPDAGEIRVMGRVLSDSSPLASRRAGIATIYQEPNVVPELSPVANVFLGQEFARLGFRSERAMRRRFAEWADMLQVSIPARGPTAGLSIGKQQAIEIMRALQQDARVVLMDEPTAALSKGEVEGLHRMIAVLRARGTSLIIISHDLSEVLSLCDRVTVMRDGRKVMCTRSADSDAHALVSAMLGRTFGGVVDDAQSRERRREGTASTLLEIRDLHVPGRLEGVSLTLRRGEVLGVAGLVGAGRTTLLRALAGVEPLATGRLSLEGDAVAWPSRPADAVRLGLAFAPEDRRAQGLVLGLPARDNVTLPSLAKVSRGGWLTTRTTQRAAAAITPSVGLPPGRLAVSAGTLSGGNQQKVVLAKCLGARPNVLLADEPTRGIDVGAKAEIFGVLRRFASDGHGVIIVSEDTEELIAFADRVIVLAGGSVSGDFEGAALSLEPVLKAMFALTLSGGRS